MEIRQIAIANTKTQRRYTINTSATTLGELQDEMTAQGIDFTGMTFTEGISKTQLLNRESLLPTNVMYKGQPTNNLVMLLTNTTKQISSGCVEVADRSRKSAYAVIKMMGTEAMDEIKNTYGKNYTLCKTEDLWNYIDENSEEFDEQSLEEEDTIEEAFNKNIAQERDFQPEPKKKPTANVTPHADLVEVLYLGIKTLVKHGVIYPEDAAALGDLTSELAARLKETAPKISDDDIDAMIADI